MTDVRAGRTAAVDLLAGGGEMGQRIREFDWSATPVGPVETWSPALRTMVRILLVNRFPQLLWWGPEYIQFYNDPYQPIPGEKHPHRALGRPASECWAEIWPVLRPLIDTPYNGGPSTWNEDILLVINRYGYMEESHFTIAYSPVPDETVPGGIGGVLATVHEITEQVLADRRMVVLRDLGARAAEAKCPDDACALAAETLALHDKDVPFAVLYLIDPDSNKARLTGIAGVEAGEPVSPLEIDLSVRAKDGWPLFESSVDHAMHVVENLAERFAKVPAGPWPDPPNSAVVVPIPASRAHELAGFLIVGISARLRFNEAYGSFLELMRTQVASAIANARAYEEERKRAEALAALDRAKTQFFSNVSHEFRTPLTLMLGPVEDLLASDAGSLSPDTRERLDVVHRNSLRLLRLVNTMLEFSRIEAGRISANYESVDLPALTTDLASSFRSACERAGLRLVVNCPPLESSMPAFVDRDMWEKIVLNLVSNAFKFTMSGEIEVSLESKSPETVTLVVRDTGVGIPAAELPRMFDRFHRVHNATARTHEGTGIGLALVHELVKLHRGTIQVESVLDEGSRFTVTIPLGDAHLDRASVKTGESGVARSMTDAFVEEALRWIPESRPERRVASVEPVPEPLANHRPRVLWADDNSDMRQYVAGLLATRYDVEAVADGREALEAARRCPPDVLLTDVMMPHMDGFELLREVRASEQLRDVPVIMISARAGEESRISGLDAGADDYLIKPFSARELMARVDAHVRMALLRKAAQRSQLEAERRKDEFLATLAHELRNPLAPVRNAVAILELKGSQEPELRWAREVITRQMHQMSRLVDDLLDVSRISHGKIELKRSRVELAAVIHGAVEASRPLIEQNAHELSITIPTEAVYLDADETRLIQVFCNLLNNAAKYSESRGRIVIDAIHADQEVVVTVRDTGFGIPEEVLPRVFDMFTQADPTMEKSKSGLGVGLTLVKRLIELHGGSVEARSEGPGKGSEFIVRLPILSFEATESDDIRKRERPVSRVSRRVLVVDDNRDAADTMAIMMRIMGHEVATAYDGLEAVKVAERFRPQIALLDIGLPTLDGYQTARMIHQEEWGRDVALIAVTGWGQKEDRRRSREAGFDYHVVKPVDPGDLVRLLAAIDQRARPAADSQLSITHANPKVESTPAIL